MLVISFMVLSLIFLDMIIHKLKPKEFIDVLLFVTMTGYVIGAGFFLFLKMFDNGLLNILFFCVYLLGLSYLVLVIDKK
jgi:hypothetical protein